MGVQGNYPGSGAINQHKYLAMQGKTPGGDSDVLDTHLKEGGADSFTDDPAMPKGKGSAGNVGIVGESISFPQGVGNVRGNIP